MSFKDEKISFTKALGEYMPEGEEEIAFKEKMLSLLAYENCFERSLLHAHFTGSAWVIDPEAKKVLLTHHAKLDRWLQLGGHADGECAMGDVAFRELKEESGIDDFKPASDKIFDLDIHGIPAKGEVPAHDHYDVRYLFQGDADIPLKKNHESKELRWVGFEEVEKLVNSNQSILRMLNKSLELAF